MKNHLPLSRLLLLRVQVPLLQEGEGQLYWCCRVGIWSRDDDLKAQRLHMVHRLSASLIFCAINEEDCIVSPVCIFVRELRTQLRDEEAEGLRVSVCLEQRAIELSLRADGQLEGDARSNAVGRHRPRLSSHAPFLSSEIRCVDPRLVEVDAADAARQLR